MFKLSLFGSRELFGRELLRLTDLGIFKGRSRKLEESMLHFAEALLRKREWVKGQWVDVQAIKKFCLLQTPWQNWGGPIEEHNNISCDKAWQEFVKLCGMHDHKPYPVGLTIFKEVEKAWE